MAVRSRIVYTPLDSPNRLMPFLSKRALSPQFVVAGNNKTYLNLHVKCAIVTKFGVCRQITIITIDDPDIKFNANPSSGSRADTCGTDGRTDMTKVKGYFRGYANAPTTRGSRDTLNKQLQHVRCNSTKPHSPFYRLLLFKPRVILTTLWQMLTG
jgi:hypothetical protein